MDVEVKIEGLQQFEARLTEIENLGGQKLLRRVFRRVAKPLLARAKGNASTLSRSGSSGALARSLRITTMREKPRQVARVAVRSVAKDRVAVYLHNAFYRRQRKGIFYGWMVDQGHRIGARKQASLGKVQARPWWTPAVQASEPEMIPAVVREMAAALKRIERRKAKSANPDSVVPE
jgi:hypothetical protein